MVTTIELASLFTFPVSLLFSLYERVLPKVRLVPSGVTFKFLFVICISGNKQENCPKRTLFLSCFSWIFFSNSLGYL